MDSNLVPAWVTTTKVGALASAIAIVLLLGVFKATRPFAVPIGVVIMAIWYFKYQRQGGAK